MRLQALVVIPLLALLLGCGPAIDRPLRGAVPGTTAPTPPGVPPTLAPSEALRFRALPTPSPGVSASPAASVVASPSVVAAPPIVRTIAPPANAHLPVGAPVGVSAILIGRGADLATASLAIDGADAGAQIEKRSGRDWSIHASSTLGPGNHSAHVLVRDAAGAAGGFTWQFSVGEPPTPEPAP